jgi:hypothetical protein
VSAEQENEDGTAETSKGRTPMKVGAEVRVSRLNTLVHCRAELGKLYRECRKREGRFPDALTGSRLAIILASVQKVIELSSFEERLVALERSQNGYPRLVPKPTRAA